MLETCDFTDVVNHKIIFKTVSMVSALSGLGIHFMFILGIQGSPRKKGNTNYFLQKFMDEVEKYDTQTALIEVTKKNIVPCLGCGYCEKKGYCITQDDDMAGEIYGLLRKADAVVIASPIYFYNVTSQVKALIDRSQALWARKYKLNLTDPARNYRQGFLLAQGATRGKNLFVGVDLTAKYFFDAIGAKFNGSLTYRRIENPGDMEKHPTLHVDIKKSVKELVSPFMERKKVFFACRENACRSQMAAAFGQSIAGDKMEVMCGGSEPADKIFQLMVDAMAEKGIDMAFKTPASMESAITAQQPEVIVTMGCREECPFVPGAQRLDWNLPDPAGKPIEFMRDVRDEIEKRVKELAKNMTG